MSHEDNIESTVIISSSLQLVFKSRYCIGKFIKVNVRARSFSVSTGSPIVTQGSHTDRPPRQITQFQF
jgi:hypothetical protein